MILMTTFRAPGHGKHRTVSHPEKDAEIERLTALVAEKDSVIESLTHDLTQAGLRIGDKDRRLGLADALLKSWAGKVVRAQAEQKRLRQAVINARPRIVIAENHARVAPYAPEVLHISDTDSSTHLEFANYQVPQPPIDPFRALGGHRADGTDAETTISMHLADLAGAR